MSYRPQKTDILLGRAHDAHKCSDDHEGAHGHADDRRIGQGIVYGFCVLLVVV